MDSYSSLSILSNLHKRSKDTKSQNKLSLIKSNVISTVHSKLKSNHKACQSYTSIIQDRLKTVKKIQSVLHNDFSLRKIDYLHQRTTNKPTSTKPKQISIPVMIRVVKIPRVTKLDTPVLYPNINN